MNFIATLLIRHTHLDECIFGLKLYAQARSIIPQHTKKGAKLRKDASCYIETPSDEKDTIRWRRKLESHNLEPYHGIEHYLAGHHLHAVSCNSDKPHEISKAGAHGAKCCYLHACDTPATCFVDVPVSGVRIGLEIIQRTRLVADTITSTGDLPEMITRP